MRLRTLLSLVLGGLLLVTAGFVGWLGYSSSHRAVKNFTEQEFALANAVAAHEVTDFLNDPANRLLDEFRVRARRGMLSLKDDRALCFDFGERLRVNRTLAWISYSDARTGHFVGVWRRADGAVVTNVSTPGQGEATEEVITVEGREIPYNRPRVKDYDPREKSWFRNAMAARQTVWSAPYVFVDGVEGITASRAWRPVDDAPPEGVFTVDFYLEDLQGLLNSVAKVDGFTLILEPDGQLICSSANAQESALAGSLGAWVREHPDFKNINGVETSHLISIQVGATSYLVALDHIEAPSGLKCVVGSMVSQPVIFLRIDHAAGQMGVVGFAALLLALLAGWFMSYRISRPLHALGNDLAKVGQFQLAGDEMPSSFVVEVNQLHDAANRMKSGLRSFIKYVPDDLVRQLLATGKEAVLGGELRRLTVFFSDIEGFATHSERVAPNDLVRELGAYFEVLTGRLHEHSATIDKFIGDGLLVFFNAPANVPNHENRACHATILALQELAARQREGRMTRFRTRVGLHSGEVLVGNIGTPARFAYTVLGDVVNVASRLENLNKVYGTQVLASHEVHGAAGDDFEWRHLDRVSVFGRKGTVDIYELMGLRNEVEKVRLQTRILYEEALTHYFARSWVEARQLFGEVAALSPHDKAASLMMTRCDHLIGQEALPDWDGVFVYHLK